MANGFKNAVRRTKGEVDENAVIELAARRGFSESNGAAASPSTPVTTPQKARPGAHNKTITLRASEEVHHWLTTVARYKRIPIGRLLERLIDNYEAKSGEDIDLARFDAELEKER